MSFTLLAARARRQHGLVTTSQALEVVTRHQFGHLIATGRLERIHREVYRVAGSPASWEQAALAAALAGGNGAVVSFLASAYLWNLAGFWEQPGVELTVPHLRRARLHAVRVHDSQILDGPHIDRRHGIPVTSVARTLCDLTACCWSNQVGRALDDALRRKLTSLRKVETVFDELATRGRRRSTIMRTLLAERGPGFDPGGSDAELRMIRTLTDSGLPAPVQQHRVRIGNRTFRLDGAYPRHLVCIEYEGFDFHTSRTAFDDRYERDRLLRIAGWLIVYVTRRTSGPRLVGDVRQALELRGWPGPPVLPPLPPLPPTR
jgi:hypothetical protein